MHAPPAALRLGLLIAIGLALPRPAAARAGPGAVRAEPAAAGDSLAGGAFAELLGVQWSRRLGPDERRVELGEPALEPGSEQVTLDGEPLAPGRDYQLDPATGILELNAAAPGALLSLRAARRPGNLPRRLELAPFRSWQDLLAELTHADAAAAAPPASAPAGAPAAGAPAVPAAFSMGGSKSLVLRMGEGEDLALEQSLRLQLEGQLGDSTRVEAVLRDDDLPFQPEGNTERLDELDKVFLEIRGPAGRARVGDFVFSAPGRALTPFERDFQGIQGEWQGSRGAAGLWLAQSQGLFESLEFSGSEGLQGPYELLSALRDDGAVVLAGSESVRLNGRLLTRGRERDYVIDYDLGTLSFATGQPISEGDIIRVDFRYSQENWERGAWGASARGRLGGLALDLLHFAEEDDPARPLAFGLDAERRAALAAAGDDPRLAVTDGVSAAPGRGRYILTHEDPEDPLVVTYAWVDSLGDYNLRFRDVGAGAGDYRAAGVSADGERYFAYAPGKQGSFVLGEQLALPAAYRLESLRLAWGGARFASQLELALSDQDANLLSGLDDADNQGLAFRAGVTGRLGAPAGAPLGLRVDAERQEAHFRYPGARRGAAEYRLWNLPGNPGLQSEDRLLLGLDWGERPQARLATTLESLRLGDRFDGRRGTLAGGLDAGGLALRGEAAAMASEDSLLGAGEKQDGRLDVGFALPLLRAISVDGTRARQSRPDSLDALRVPEQRGSHDRRAIELRLGSRSEAAPWTLSWREERIAAPGAGTDRLRRLRAGRQGGLPRGGRLEASAHYQRRRGSLDSEQFQAEARGSWLARAGGWGGEARYRLGSQRQRLRQSRLVFIGLDLGDLNEDGIYVGEGEGDWRRLSVLAEEAVRTQNLELETRLEKLEARAGAWPRRLGSESRLILREENRDEEPWRLAALDFSRFRRPGSTLLGSLELLQELRLRPAAGGLELRYRFRQLDRLDGRDSAGELSEREGSHELRARRGGERSSLEASLRLAERRRRGQATLGAGGSYRVAERGSALNATQHLAGRLSALAGAEALWQRDALRGLARRALSLEPGLTLTPVASLRLEARWAFSHSSYGEGDPAAGRPWFFAAPGWTRMLRLEATAQAGANLTLSARYELREESGEPARQRLRLESRAFF